MPRDKRQTIERVTELRSYGLSLRQISERLRMGKSHVGRIVKMFRVERGTLCPHCGLARDAIPLDNSCGKVSPEES